MVAFGTGAIHRILSLFQPPPHISPHKASSSGFLTRLALLLSINSLGCGGAVVPAVDSSMIPQTTHMRALACGVAWQGLFTNHVSRLLAHGSGVAKEAILDAELKLEDLEAVRASVYPAIDPEPLYAARSYSGKVVLVTLGRDTALQYMHADVRDVESVRGAVKSVIQRFGKLDILIANLKCGHTFRIHAEAEQDANAWWNSFEANIRSRFRGSFNFISTAEAALENTHSYIVVISSAGAQLRVPDASDTCIAKFAVNRENWGYYYKRINGTERPNIRAFALAPLRQPLMQSRLAPVAVEALRPLMLLPSLLQRYSILLPVVPTSSPDGLYTSPFPATSSDVMRLGSYYSANWDMAEVEQDWKDLIVQNGGCLSPHITLDFL
ncbi:hypothetical protein V8E52_008104 [Russula decolorans]